MFERQTYWQEAEATAQRALDRARQELAKLADRAMGNTMMVGAEFKIEDNKEKTI